jgi:hypothetical protein
MITRKKWPIVKEVEVCSACGYIVDRDRLIPMRFYYVCQDQDECARRWDDAQLKEGQHA